MKRSAPKTRGTICEALTEPQTKKRHAFGLFMQGLGHTADKYYQKPVLTDICNRNGMQGTGYTATKVQQYMKGRRVGRSPHKLENNCTKEARARRGTVRKKVGWMSKSKKNENYNLRGADKALKLHSCDAVASKHAYEHCASSGRGQNTWVGE